MTATASASAGSQGSVVPEFDLVRAEFDELLAADPGYSAQVSAYWRGEKVVDLAGGPDAGLRSLSGVFSVSKGVSALTTSLLVRTGALDVDRPVSYYWPEFAANGKSGILVRELLSHQAGLVGTRDGLSLEDLCDSSRAAGKLAGAPPAWRPGQLSGYHGLTIGVFMEELCRRIDGRPLQQLYAEEIRDPYAVDFYLGLPASEVSRVRPRLPALGPEGVSVDVGDGLDTLGLAFKEDGRTRRADQPSTGNDPRVHEAGLAAVGGVGTAEALARVYAAALTGVDGRPPFLDALTIQTMSQEQVWALDRVLNVQMSFGIVFMKPQPRMDFCSYLGFGHDGAGGGLGFADPMYDLGFGYIPQRMQVDNERCMHMSRCVRHVIRQLTS